MALFRKSSILILLLLFTWFHPAIAETKDVLLVNISFDATRPQQFEILGIEQRVLDESNFTVITEGAYKLSIVSTDTELASNSFDTVQYNNPEMIGNNGEYLEGNRVAREQILSVILPITKDIQPDYASIKIIDSKTKTTILEKKFSEISILISQAKQSTVVAQDNSEYPSFESEPTLPVASKTSPLLGIIIALGIILIGLVVYWFIKRSQKTNLPPPAS